MLIEAIRLDLETDKKNMKHVAKQLVRVEKHFRETLKHTLDSGIEKCQEIGRTVRASAQELRKDSQTCTVLLSEISRETSLLGRQIKKEEGRLEQTEGTMGY